MERCYVLVPSFDPFVGSQSFSNNEHHDWGCLRPRPHFGKHVCLQPDGMYRAWESDLECTDCEAAGVECECFVSVELSPDEASKFLDSRE